MEFKFEHVSLHLFADAKQTEELLTELVRQQRSELMILRDIDNPGQFRGVVPERFYTDRLEGLYGVEKVWRQGGCVILDIRGQAIHGFFNRLVRMINPLQVAKRQTTDEDIQWFLNMEARRKPLPAQPEEAKPSPVRHVEAFLRNNSPVTIEQALNQRIMGQEAMTAAVADFLYYHALRLLHPQLPPRPLLISGPSGCGKTEVWRKVSELYGSIFPVKIIDGSNLSCDGWAGNFKVSTFLDRKLTEGGILVVDEFDKLVKPKHSARGENVSYDMQSELLKLMEGEYRLTENKKETDMTTRKMGFVMTGAFADLQKKKQQTFAEEKRIGFCAAETNREEKDTALENEDFIAYGVMPELMGRIAVHCEAKQLTEQVYLDIIWGPYSRVTQLSKVLAIYGVDVAGEVTDGEILELIAQSKQCGTGVRWVAAQVENRILERIREKGLFSPAAAA